MKYLPLVWAGLWRKPLRATFTLLSLVVAFALFGLLQGLSVAFDSAVGSAKEDRIFTDPRFGVPVPYSYGAQIAAVKGVRVVAPRIGLFGYYQDPKNTMGIITTDERFLQTRDEISVNKDELASWKANRTGLLIGTAIAKKFDLKVGDTFPFRSILVKKDGSGDWTFQVSGIIDDKTTTPGNTGYALGHYEYINEDRAGDRDKVDRFLIRIDDPRRAAEIGKEIDAKFANSPFPTRTQSDRYLMQSNAMSLGDIHFFVNAIVGSVMFMLLFMTATAMMQAYRERIPELAVLKTVGFADVGLLTLVIAESLVLCLLGASIGLVVARLLGIVVRGVLPVGNKAAGLPLIVIVAGIATALLVAVISGMAPAWQAKRLNVIDGLAVR